MRSSEKYVNVHCVTNGWVLEWRNESLAKTSHEYWREMGREPIQPDTHGTEVFHDKEQLMKRIASLL